jgi:hypothetical protein
MPPNKRDYRRHPKRLLARFRDQSDQPWKRCFTSNISVSGMFLESSYVPRFDRIEVEIMLKDDQPVMMVGQLVRGSLVPAQLLRVAKGGFALRLLEAPPAWYEFCLALGK